MKVNIDISTPMWIPKITKIENGYIVQLKSPIRGEEITETYAYHEWQDVIDFLSGHFNENQ